MAITQFIANYRHARLHEEQRKCRQADVGHRIDALALPLVGKGGAGIPQAAQKMIENQHPDLESEIRFRENQKNLPPGSAI